MTVEVVAIPAGQRQRAGWLHRRSRSEVVDGTADGLRSVGDLRPTFEDLEPLEAVDRRRPYRLTGLGATVLQEQLTELSAFAALGLQRLAGRSG